MTSIWKRLFGASDEPADADYNDTVARARKLIALGNHEDACGLLRQCEQKQHAEGMYLLGWCYWEGKGVREDAAHAKWLWQRAADMGYEPAVTQWEKLEASRKRLEAENREEESKTPTEKGYK